MKKCGRRLLALLMACTMLMVCTATAFADDVTEEITKYPKPNSWFTTGSEAEKEIYNNIIKIPCKGSLSLIASIDEEYVSGEIAQTMCPQQYSLKDEEGNNVNSDCYVKNGTFFTKTVSKGDYSFGTVLVAGKYKWKFVPAGTSISSVKNSASKTMTVTWKKVTGVTSYQIQYSTKSDFSTKTTITLTKSSTVSRTIKSLTKGKKYYVRIRTYSTINGVKCYSKWSAKKSLEIEK